MQTNDFEKLVSNQMEDFQLQPNDEVWQKVAVRIQPEKKRRRAFIFWLLPILLISGIGGYYYFTNQNVALNVSNESKPAILNDQKPAETNVLENPNHNKIETHDNKPAITKSLNTKTNDRQNSKELEYTFSRSSKGKSIVILPSDKYVNNNSKIKSKNESEVIIPESKNENQATASNLNNDNSTSIQPKAFENNKIDTVVVSKMIDTAKSLVNSEPTISKKKEAQNKKWKFGIATTLGMSNITGNANTKSLAQFNNSSLSTSIGAQSQSSEKQYSLALSGGLGIQLQKQLSTKSAFSIGLNFHSYRANTKVGQFVDSTVVVYDSVFQNSVSVNSFYKNGTETKYTEHFGYLQLPVNFRYQLNKNEAKPLMVYGGITPGLLISSKSLHYNQASSINYKSNDHLRNWNFSIQTGILFSLLDKKSYTFQLGPEVQYHLMNTTKKEIQAQGNINFLGVKGNLLFKK